MLRLEQTDAAGVAEAELPWTVTPALLGPATVTPYCPPSSSLQPEYWLWQTEYHDEQDSAFAKLVGTITNGYGASVMVGLVAAALNWPVVVVADAVCGNMKLSDPVLGPVSRPVQLAPVGQQAMLWAASWVQVVPSLQHTFELPISVHGLYPDGQESALLRTWRTSKARLVVSAFRGAWNGEASSECDSTVGARNVAQIHQDAFILAASLWPGCDQGCDCSGRVRCAVRNVVS
jgi:hypothetical protein